MLYVDRMEHALAIDRHRAHTPLPLALPCRKLPSNEFYLVFLYFLYTAQASSGKRCESTQSRDLTTNL